MVHCVTQGAIATVWPEMQKTPQAGASVVGETEQAACRGIWGLLEVDEN